MTRTCLASLVAASLLTTGCYPIYKTVQKKARIQVVDERGKAIAGAEVHLITSSYPYGNESHRETKRTDAEGVATFTKRREWRVESLMIHGAEVFFWNWCVSLEGHRTVATTHRSAEAFENDLETVLEPGRPSPCGDPMRRGWEPAEPAFGGHPPETRVSCLWFPAESLERPQPELEPRSECATFDAAAHPRIDPEVLALASYDDGLTEMLIDGAWYYVRPTGESLRVVTYDNGADRWSEGLVRVDRMGRIAYADRRFREILGPRFTWGWPFENGFAIACVDCRIEEPDGDGHRPVTGGRWGAVDRSGRAVVNFTHTSYAEVVRAIAESEPDTAVEVRIDATQAEATLDLLAARARGEVVPASSWARVFESEGYRRVLAREWAIDEQLGIDRGYSDESFQEWARSEAALEGLAGRQRTLAAWAEVDVQAAAHRALAYLPEETRLEATVYPIVRKQANSFVWDLPRDPAIFLSIGADVGAEEVELTLAHELHHVGLSGRCAEPEAGEDEGVAAAQRWLSGFGEGLAVLAAAGGPKGETHAPAQVDLRAAWQERLDNLESDMRDLEAFLIDVADGRTAGEDAQRRGMAFVSAEGVPQGAFYSVGWFMAVAVERHLGWKAVVAATCDHGRLLTDYQRVAESATEEVLPLWSKRLLTVLDLEKSTTCLDCL